MKMFIFLVIGFSVYLFTNILTAKMINTTKRIIAPIFIGYLVFITYILMIGGALIW